MCRKRHSKPTLYKSVTRLRPALAGVTVALGQVTGSPAPFTKSRLVPASRTEKKRGRCAMCDWRTDKKGTSRCTVCSAYLCKDHMIITCSTCAGKWGKDNTSTSSSSLPSSSSSSSLSPSSSPWSCLIFRYIKVWVKNGTRRTICIVIATYGKG